MRERGSAGRSVEAARGRARTRPRAWSRVTHSEPLGLTKSEASWSAFRSSMDSPRDLSHHQGDVVELGGCLAKETDSGNDGLEDCFGGIVAVAADHGSYLFFAEHSPLGVLGFPDAVGTEQDDLARGPFRHSVFLVHL